MTERFDIVIVGARCAGAALATFLARLGAKVLVVERDRLHSDQVISTHTIHPPGVAILDELGVGDTLRSVTPISRRIRLRKGDTWVDISFPPGRQELCPRRDRLDGLLQDAAMAAGCELRDRTRATRVLFDSDRAVGVEIEHAGSRSEVRADLLVGADGRRSSIAQQVGAEEYMAYDAPRAMYWAYWRAPAVWRTASYPFDMYIGHIGLDARAIFQTDHDQLLIGSLPAVAEARHWRKDALTALKRNLSRDPATGPLVADSDPISTVRGTLKERYFFRQGTGSGWALVGDAGHHKEFVIGDGITEALIQAKALSKAISDGKEESLMHWWRARDIEALPGYFWGRDEGSLSPPARLESLIFARVARDERLQALMCRLPEHECSPYDALPIREVLVALFTGLLRGGFGVVPEFIAQSRRVAEYKKVLAERKRLLDEVERKGPRTAQRLVAADGTASS